MITITLTNDWSVIVESDSPTFKGWTETFQPSDASVRSYNFIVGLRKMAEALGQSVKVITPTVENPI